MAHPGGEAGAVSTHSRLKAAAHHEPTARKNAVVSTHSRLKAAGWAKKSRCLKIRGFNTQPPEGGWTGKNQAAQWQQVSTHSRLKAAVMDNEQADFANAVSTHSRLKAAVTTKWMCRRPC